ncbi:heterokaryon incompatibility protein-domain-containing protein [Lophiotrema nucula]|uniref:Heterokaryon incompatibility protein-domain-containing protein n=1 Tax=Lophiotrema nucula TaxID=690887 RepID=A0A6A5YZ39_9PLEO|nr:heterokaryon incompatibility protein-domain-containing protein [Lophiotrema nucula]
MAQHHLPSIDAGDAIRLLELHPGSHGDPIVCRLLPANLNHAPPYEALSYVWGSQNLMCEILCDGNPFQIGFNLRDALDRLRLPLAKRLLWVDAACINQADNNKKKYQQAGDNTTLALTVIDQIRRLSQSMMISNTDHFNNNTLSPNDIDFLVEKVYLDLTERQCSALAAFFDRPWFERIWVIQEVGNANFAQVLIGEHERPWQSLGMAAA